MRVLPITGAVLIALGVWTIVWPPSYSREQSLFRLGALEATVRERQPVPAWAGGAVLGAGTIVLLLGLVRR